MAASGHDKRGEVIQELSRGSDEITLDSEKAGNQQGVTSNSPPTHTTAAIDVYQRMNKVAWCLLVASIISSPFLFSFDLVVVGNLQPRILEDLGQIEKLPWITVAYGLGGMSTTWLWGRCYALFNIKWTFIAAYLFFQAGSAVTGAAPNMDVLIVGRVLNGLGGLGIYSGALHTLALITTIAQRPFYFSLITLAFGSAAIVAPVIGGKFADSRATWRWGFYINVCIGGLFAPGYLFLFPSQSRLPPGVSFTSKLQRLDGLGNVLWAGATATLIMAISFGGAMFDWGSGQIIGLFVAAVVLWPLFAVQQWQSWFTTAESRIFPVHLLKSMEMCIMFMQVAASSAVAQLPVLLIPIYFQFVRGTSAISAGLHLLPLVACRSVFILVNGGLMPKFGYVMPWYLAGATISLAGCIPFLMTTTETSVANIYGYTALIGCGVGLYNQATFAVASVRVAPQLVPSAVSFMTVGQVTGITLALAVVNSIFFNRATALIGQVLPDLSRTALEEALLGGEATVLLPHITPESQTRVLQAIVKALNDSWAPIVAACAMSVVLTAFMKRDKLWQ